MAVLRKNVVIQLGAFAVTVNVESALDGAKEVSLNTLCCGTSEAEHGPAQARQQLKCPVCDNADKDTFVKGKDMGAGRFVVVPPQVLDQAGAEGGGVSMAIALNAHPREQVGRSLNGDKCYFLVPANAGSAESYALVAAAINSRPDLAFVVTWAVRSANALYQVDVLEGRLVLKQLAWPASVRALPEVPTLFDDKYLPVAAALIDTMVTNYDPSAYLDTKSKIITEYLQTADTTPGAVVDETGALTSMTGPVDMETALLAALAAATKDKAPVQAMPKKVPANVARIGAPARKRAVRKPAAKKTTAARKSTKSA